MKNYLAYGLAFLCNHAFAQFNETIRTGRPEQAIGAFTVGHGIFQIQSGFDFFGSKVNPSNRTEGYLNNTVVRYGLTEPFEVSALVECKTETITENDIKRDASGLSALDVGMRYHIYTGKYFYHQEIYPPSIYECY